MNGCYIAGTGSYLPEIIVTNKDVAPLVGITPQAILRMTGIRERRKAGPAEATSDLATNAALSAISSAGIAANDIDLIILATTSPDIPSPATACFVQKNIGARKAAAFDINASCSGFLYAFSMAEMFIKNAQANTVLVIAAEVKSRFVDPADKETAILFGDGAGAVVLRCTDRNNYSSIIKTRLYADGSNWKWIHLPAGGSRIPPTPLTIASGLHNMRMDGSRVYRAAIKTLKSMIVDVVKECSMAIDDIDSFIFHQANLRIINQVIDRLGIDKEKVPLSLPVYGNTSSASIPITLDQAVRGNRIKDGDIIAMASFGGGLTWGASIIRWVQSYEL